jgi:hypothetical protein
MADYFKINGVPLDGRSLPEPAHGGAIFSVQDIDSAETGRNQEGAMIRERVATKIKWQFTFPPLSRAMCSALLNAISGVTFELTYPDPFSPTEMVTKTCYVGDRTAPAYSTAYGMPMWENIAFSIVEI